MNDFKNYIEVIDEIEKLDEVIKTPRYRMCCRSLLEFLKAACYYLKNMKNLNNINGREQRRISHR